MNFALIKNYCFVSIIAFLLVLSGCNEEKKQEKQTKTYSSEVIVRWMGVQSNMLLAPTGNPFGFNPSRYLAYCGVAVYESVVPGMKDYKTLQGQLTDMPTMPAIEAGADYHWPTCANAALASMTKNFYSVTTAYNEPAVTGLENELNDKYRSEVGDAIFDRSVAFGKEVASRIFEWSKNDKANWPTSFTMPSGDGVWKSENDAPPINPYWGFNRLMVPGSLNNTVSPPPVYSTDVSSPYYKDMKEVYDVSQNLTHDQKLTAKYYNDVNPGFPAGAHYISTIKQLMEQLNPTLEVAALTYAKTGITFFDATTGSFKAKYDNWKERPFTYIRSMIAAEFVPEWKPFLSTPNYPDFPSNHAVFAGSIGYALETIYGSNVAFSDASYEGIMADLGDGPENLGTRHFNSIDEMVQEIAISRLYGGIHYRYSCEEGVKQGRKIAQNIDNSVKFLK